MDRGVKLEVSDFYGEGNPEVFFDWLHSIESFFRWYSLSEERKLFFAEAKLKGTARIWWEKYQQTHYIAIRSWEGMRSAMTRYFIPPNYKQRAHLQFTQLVQGSYSIEEYTNKFYGLAMRSGFPWNEDVMISTYCQGLNPNISLGLAASWLYTMVDAIQIEYQMEEEIKRRP